MSDPASALNALRTACRSLILATAAADGTPDASYAPFAIADDGSLLILVSGLARHTTNLRRSGRASAMVIEDEQATSQPYARRRVTYACRVEPVAPASQAWEDGVNALERRHGGVVTMLRGLRDFELLRLIPESGVLVLGFGRAWQLGGPGCSTLDPLGPR